MAKNKIKEPEKNKSSRIALKDNPPDYDALPPLFSLERVQNGSFCFSQLEKDDKAAFSEAIFKRKNMTWLQIRQADRHGLGTEKIAKKSIKTGIPQFITDEVNDFLAFRFNGKKAMVGYKVNNIFYVLWFDATFKLYSHS